MQQLHSLVATLLKLLLLLLLLLLLPQRRQLHQQLQQLWLPSCPNRRCLRAQAILSERPQRKPAQLWLLLLQHRRQQQLIRHLPELKQRSQH